MKRILLTALTILASLPMLAQLNVQMHYDFADALYGTELELTKNLVWPTDGLNDRFYAIPTLAAKWTF